MKKFFSLLLCLLLLCSTCYAEVDFNVDDYTDDELIEIMKIIYEANTQLGYLYSNDVIVVGEDIPAGAYEFWVEEDDIGFSQKMIEQDLDYHCGFTTLCMIQWGEKYDKWNYDNYIDIFNDEYGCHKMVTLEEGQVLWTNEVYGANFLGLRMKYIPDRKSGLFGN